MKSARIWFAVLMFFAAVSQVYAVPETVSVRVTDVTPVSFAVVWMTDVPASPTLQVCRDSAMTDCLSGSENLKPMPDADPAIATDAKQKGIMKVRAQGLKAQSRYYVRTVTVDPANPANIGYSGVLEVTTASNVVAHKNQDEGGTVALANDQLAMRIYVAPGEANSAVTVGDLLVLETPNSGHPVSAFAGQGIAVPEGLLDLNNLFGLTGESLDLVGGETALLRIYRGGTLSALLHYRRFPTDTSLGGVGEPVRGFFADINLDGMVDAEDFELFKAQYRLQADDAAFNPDYNFLSVGEGQTVTSDRIDAQDFARFAPEYGRTDLP